MIEVFSSGGGTQSCAIAGLIVQGRLPKPDFCVIADTGREMPTTWAYLDAVTRPALATVGVEVHRVKASEFAAPWGRQIFANSGQLMIPAYTDQAGRLSKLSAFCSGAWKAEVVDSWLSKVHGVTRSGVRKWIGFSRDETTRIIRMRRGEEFLKGRILLPLVTDVPTTRQECIALVKAMGWPKPPRSRCWMCPNQSDREWAEVQRDHPAEFAQAVALDESNRERDAHVWLHSTGKPLKDADLREPDDLFSGGCASGECCT